MRLFIRRRAHREIAAFLSDLDAPAILLRRRTPNARVIGRIGNTILCLERGPTPETRRCLTVKGEREETLPNGDWILHGGRTLRFDIVPVADGQDPVTAFWSHVDRRIDEVYLRGADDPLLAAPAPSPDDLRRMEAWLADILVIVRAEAGGNPSDPITAGFALPQRPPGPGYRRKEEEPHHEAFGSPRRMGVGILSTTMAGRMGLPPDALARIQAMLDALAARHGIGGVMSVADTNYSGEGDPFMLHDQRRPIIIRHAVPPAPPSVQEVAAARRRLQATGLGL